jgi:hypothetical protein
MAGEFMIPVVLFIVIGACIVVSLWLRHRLYQKQIDAITLAIEKGIDPDELKKAIEIKKPNGGDINGNWKAGVILLGTGLIFMIAMLPLMIVEFIKAGGFTDDVAGMATMLIFPGLGLVFLYIHRTIVGPVIKHGEKHPRDQTQDN